MAQVHSTYERRPRDFYPTPPEPTLAVLPFLPYAETVWEPAAGDGSMSDILKLKYDVISTDIHPLREDIEQQDFLETNTAPRPVNGIITNPPFNLAQQFIELGLEVMRKRQGWVAMLLRNEYDAAKGRQHLFGECPIFRKKIVLCNRIRFIPGSTGAPSHNHAWYIWDHSEHHGGPALHYVKW